MEVLKYAFISTCTARTDLQYDIYVIALQKSCMAVSAAWCAVVGKQSVYYRVATMGICATNLLIILVVAAFSQI